MISGCKKKKVIQERLCSRIDLTEIVALIPKTTEQIHAQTENVKRLMDQAFIHIDQVAAQQRTYINTVLEYEKAYFNFYTHYQIMQMMAQLAQDSALQTAANVALIDLNQYMSQILSRNVTLYQALKEYAQFGKDPYRPIISVDFFVKDMLKRYARQGMQLSVAQRADVAAFEQEINQVAGRFQSNLTCDQRHIIVPLQELQGVSEAFLQTLSQDDQGNYIVPATMTTFFMVMENCEIESTRRAYFTLFGQCGYPQNETVLLMLQQKRHDLAALLGFDNFAAYQLDNLMMKTVKKADTFLWSMIKELQPYDDRDFMQITRILPESVTLTEDNKLKPWDEAFVKSWYIKNHFKIDDYQISQYFPLEHVLEKMLKQLSSFFHISFEKQPIDNLWSTDLFCYRVRSLKHQAILGYLLFDVYQRPSKRQSNGEYQLTLIPAIRDDCSIPCVGAAVVVAHFEKSENQSQVLLEFNDVISLLHEIGHGIHAIFGATRFTQYSGTQVKHDFIEAPSQMLEYWFDDPEFLHNISYHVQTGAPMDRAMIEKLIASQKFGRAGRMLKQLFLGLVSLHLFSEKNHNNHEMIENLYKKVFKHIAYDPQYYFEMNFSHLAHEKYAAAYYIYPWTQVIAADLFAHIKQYGLFNYQIGTAYVTEILSPGGSRHPQEMCKRFLGRSIRKSSFLEML